MSRHACPNAYIRLVARSTAIFKKPGEIKLPWYLVPFEEFGIRSSYELVSVINSIRRQYVVHDEGLYYYVDFNTFGFNKDGINKHGLTPVRLSFSSPYI